MTGGDGQKDSGTASAPQHEEEPPAPPAAEQAPVAKKTARAEMQEKAEEDAFTPSGPARKIVSVPTPETNKASAQNAATGDDVQNKIAALQRQLSDLTKKA